MANAFVQLWWIEMVLLVFIVALMMFMCWLGQKTRRLTLIYFSPAFVFCLAWLLVFSLYQFGSDFIRTNTIIYLILFITSFVVPGLLLLTFGPQMSDQRLDWARLGEVKIRTFSMVMLTAQMCALVAGLFYLYGAIQQAGFSSIANAVESFSSVRGVMATEGYDVPILARLVGQLKYFNYIAPVAFLLLWLTRNKGRGLYFCSLFLAIVYPVIALERSGVLRVLIINLVAYVYCSRNKVKALRNGIITVMAIFIPLIFVVPAIRGQGEEGGDNIYNYVVGALAGLDAFIEGASGDVVVLEDQPILVTADGYRFGDAPAGLETATELYRICNVFGACDIKIPNGKEYIYDPLMTNVYTGLRSFYQDFGPVGMPLATILFSIFLHLLFLRFSSGLGVFGLFGVGYIAYVSAFMILANNFLLRDLVFTAAICAVLPGLGGYRSLFWWGVRRPSGVKPVAGGL